jgi:hypothetical protein
MRFQHPLCGLQVPRCTFLLSCQNDVRSRSDSNHDCSLQKVNGQDTVTDPQDLLEHDLVIRLDLIAF